MNVTRIYFLQEHSQSHPTLTHTYTHNSDNCGMQIRKFLRFPFGLARKENDVKERLALKRRNVLLLSVKCTDIRNNHFSVVYRAFFIFLSIHLSSFAWPKEDQQPQQFFFSQINRTVIIEDKITISDYATSDNTVLLYSPTPQQTINHLLQPVRMLNNIWIQYSLFFISTF